MLEGISVVIRSLKELTELTIRIIQFHYLQTAEAESTNPNKFPSQLRDQNAAQHLHPLNDDGRPYFIIEKITQG